MFINNSFIGKKQQNAWDFIDIGHNPWAISFDPNIACQFDKNDRLVADYENKRNLSLEMLYFIINQCKMRGIYVYFYSGKEPLMRKKDILYICDKHSDCLFLAFTNGGFLFDTFILHSYLQE